MKLRTFVVLLAAIVVLPVVSCVENDDDRPARATIEDGCIFKAYRSDDSEMEEYLELWPERVVIWENLSEDDVSVSFRGRHELFGVNHFTLRPGKTRRTRVKKHAPYDDYYIDIECRGAASGGEPGMARGDANPKGKVGDDPDTP